MTTPQNPETRPAQRPLVYHETPETVDAFETGLLSAGYRIHRDLFGCGFLALAPGQTPIVVEVDTRG